MLYTARKPPDANYTERSEQPGHLNQKPEQHIRSSGSSTSCKRDCTIFHFPYNTRHCWEGMAVFLACHSTLTTDWSQLVHKSTQFRIRRGIPSRPEGVLPIRIRKKNNNKTGKDIHGLLKTKNLGNSSKHTRART